jgi:hypothetical protein
VKISKVAMSVLLLCSSVCEESAQWAVLRQASAKSVACFQATLHGVSAHEDRLCAVRGLELADRLVVESHCARLFGMGILARKFLI